MKRLKLFLWIFILFIMDIVVINRIDFFNSAPDLVFVFVIAYAVLEEEFSYVIGVSIICGVCAGALFSSNFPVSVLLYAYSALLVTALRGKLRYVPAFVKALFLALILSFIGEAIMYFILNLSFKTDVILKIILPFGVYNFAAELIIYPLVKKTMITVNEKEKLIPD